MFSLTSHWLVWNRCRRKPMLAVLALGAFRSVLAIALVDAAVAQTKPSKPPVPALYPTRTEAEKAAKEQFHCTGAHPMGQRWMPCSQHAHDHSSHP